MKQLLASIWHRRWCRFLGAGLVLCALPMLHPYIRQSAFGPQINGVPWCVWEDDFRNAVHDDGTPPGWLRQTLEKVGFIRPREMMVLDIPADAEEMLPLYLHLAEDGDAKVRRAALNTLWRECAWLGHPDQGATAFHPDIVLPVCRQHLDDRDPECRLQAALAVWAIAQDVKVKAVFVPFVQDKESVLRPHAIIALSEIAVTDPDLFDLMATLAEDADSDVRRLAMAAMQHFGKRGVPILRKGLHDPDTFVQRRVCDTAVGMGQDGVELIPDLLALLNDPRPNVRSMAADALSRRKWFAKPGNGVD